ncbi:hypothetical protein PILCRDRAFT_327304 [Piloderma croceum F 1598]|uniref:Uncharacterized protein n=1 Tax=Piloderma croceum (strain F 1598) TaxID=765440 RepID=A0A0C3G715_PILCF|nr:hypothetical protein PILCRDRAFT_327304 [Piloderma croceum F 1598]
MTYQCTRKIVLLLTNDLNCLSKVRVPKRRPEHYLNCVPLDHTAKQSALSR